MADEVKVPNQADYAKLRHDVSVLGGKLSAANQANRKLTDKLANESAKLVACQSQLEASLSREADLREQLEAAPRIAAVAPAERRSGPRADEPRVMYSASEVESPPGRVFENLEQLTAAQTLQPDFWFETPDEARAAFASAMSTPLPGVVPPEEDVVN